MFGRSAAEASTTHQPADLTPSSFDRAGHARPTIALMRHPPVKSVENPDTTYGRKSLSKMFALFALINKPFPLPASSQLSLIYRSLSDLIPDPRNVRTHPGKEVGVLPPNNIGGSQY